MPSESNAAESEATRDTSCHGCPTVAVQNPQSKLLYPVDTRSCYRLPTVNVRNQTSHPITTMAETPPNVSPGLHNARFAHSAPTTLINRRPHSPIPPHTPNPQATKHTSQLHLSPARPQQTTSATSLKQPPQTPPLHTTLKRDLHPPPPRSRI